MNTAAQNMEFERGWVLMILIWTQSWVTKQQSWQRLQNRDVLATMWTRADVCAGFLCPSGQADRAINLFPYYNDPDEDFLTYGVKFYQRNPTWSLMKSWSPRYRRGRVKASSDTSNPQAPAREWSSYQSNKNACQSGAEVQSPWKIGWKRPKVIENLENSQIPTPVCIESFDNPTSWGPVRFASWWSLVTG